MKVLSYSAIALAVLASTSSMAALQVGESTTNFFQSATHPAAISAEIGTLGYGANIAWGVNDSTELQAGWNGMDFDGDTKINANDSWINYNKALGKGYENFAADLKYDVSFSNPYLGVQMRPFKNAFTLGTGVMVPKNDIKLNLTSTDGGRSNISINGESFDVTQNSTIAIHAENKNRLAPYATLGFRPNIDQRWGAFAEVGAAYMGNLKSNVDINGSVTKNDGQTVSVPTTKAREELENKIAGEIKSTEWYPIAKVGLTMRF